MIENLKLGLMLYVLANLMFVAKGMDEATWLLTQPCKEPSAATKLFPGYSLGCMLGVDHEIEGH